MGVYLLGGQLTKHREYLKDLTKFAALDEVGGVNTADISPTSMYKGISAVFQKYQKYIGRPL